MPEQPEKKGLSANWAVAEVDYLLTKFGRYTRFVVFSKWFLLIFAVGLITTLIALPLVSQDTSGLRVSFVDKTGKPTEQATSPVMHNPVYRGTDASGQQFRVNGIEATQVTPTLIRLQQVDAQLVTKTGGWRSLTARSAEYDQTAKTIVLTGEVILVDDQGYTFVTERAVVNTDTSHVSGDQPISGDGPLGNLLASGFEIRDSGARITFLGGAKQVRLKIEREKK